MEFDNVEAIKSLVAIGLGCSIVPSMSLGAGHVPADHLNVVPLQPRAMRQVGLIRLRGKRGTSGVKVVAQALMQLRRSKTR